MKPTEKSNTPLTDKFLEMYGRYTTHSPDLALHILIRKNKEHIEPLLASKDPLWLHKAFRQTDVCDDPLDDMLIWHLIHASRDFFETLDWFWNEALDKKSERRMAVQLLEKDAQIATLISQLAKYQKDPQ